MIKRLFFSILFLCYLMNSRAWSQEKGTRIACIGNSVTAGYLLLNPSLDSYPAQLQRMLGPGYEVGNFGFSGATLLKKGHNPYYKTPEFTRALAFHPDKVIIDLGLNDSDPRDWPNFKDDFKRDYAWLIDTFRKQNPAVAIYLCRLTPISTEHPRFKSGTRDWYWQIQKQVEAVARVNHTALIDLHEGLYNRPDLFTDALHPDQEGAGILAKTICQYLTGNYGGLQLPYYFTDNMVLQRNQVLVIGGTANRGDTVEVSWMGSRRIAVTPADGKWQVRFPSHAAGGPYRLRVHTRARDIVLENILLGDVWFCSGQSNMGFPLKKAYHSGEDIHSAALLKRLRLLRVQGLQETDNRPWDAEVLEMTNQLQFFKGRWQTCDSASAAEFSAIAFYFGKKILQEEQVPIGLIELAVGGSPIVSWIDRYSLEQDDQVVDVFSHWRSNEWLHAWVRERAAINLSGSANPKQRHPYEPCYNYEAGVKPFTQQAIRGVLWYQGESDDHNVELYEHLLPVLVRSWRHAWGLNFPFYYVQLSSLARPSWAVFRDAQNRLQHRIANAAMAVSMDCGDSLDVHPVHKKEVAGRLALLASHYSYLKKVVAMGPEADKVFFHHHQLIIEFKNARRLSTVGDKPLLGFELVTEKGQRLDVPARIRHRRVIIPWDGHEKIIQVRYAYQPFTRANLINQASLPASTFSVPVKF